MNLKDAGYVLWRSRMVVVTNSDRLRSTRQDRLMPYVAEHPHACLTCAQREGCTREPCSSNVPVEERCCPLLGRCEFEKVVAYVGVKPATPKYKPRDLPLLDSEPLFIRDFNLCIGCTRCVRACKDLRDIGVLGFVFKDGKRIVGMLGPNPEEADCRFCGSCVEVCPTGALTDKDPRVVHEKEEILVPCRSTCPAGVDIPRYIRLVSEGKLDDAFAVLKESLPLFSRSLGRICLRPCELVCRRGEVNEPIAICDLKWYITDNGSSEGMKAGDATGKKVAVIGGGPAGLTASYYLARVGHGVTIFESDAELGGMQRLGIPKYRLPMDVIDEDLKDLEGLGIEVIANTTVGQDVQFNEIVDGHDAVFIATGAPLSRKLDLSGTDSADVLWGLDFLKAVNKGEEVSVKESVVVIGGGNVAIDVAMTARRLGAQSVELTCLESREIMPASEREVDEAEEEGIKVNCCWGPDLIISEDGKVKGIELKSCTSVFDADGKFAPTYDESSKECIDCDTVIMAIGQATDLGFLGEPSAIEVRGGMIKCDPETLVTSNPKVFGGGDAVKMPGSVVDAIAAGRKAASSIDKFLGGSGDVSEILVELDTSSPSIGKVEGFAKLTRKRPKSLTMEDSGRATGFEEVYSCFSEEEAVAEAQRCLRCELRLELSEVPWPPEKVVALTDENVSAVPGTDGVYQLYDEEKKVTKIKGVANLKEALLEELAEETSAKFFEFEEDKMFSKRESELLQQYLQKYGEMPGGGDDDDDLF